MTVPRGRKGPAPKEAKEEQRKKSREWQSSVQAGISKINEYAGISFTPEKKKMLHNELFLNTVKTTDGKYVSKFIASFFDAYNKNPEKLMLMAEILRDDFDPEKFSKSVGEKAKTKEVSRLKALGKKKKTGSGRSKKPKSIADLFQ